MPNQNNLLAQADSAITIVPFLNRAIDLILQPLVILLFTLAIAYLLYNGVRFLSLEPGDKNRDEAWKAILWGLVGLTIMFSVYGLIRLVLNTFGISPGDIQSPGARGFLGF